MGWNGDGNVATMGVKQNGNGETTVGNGWIYTVSQKKLQTYFLSELCQTSTDCVNFWHKDSKEDKLFWGVLIFHLPTALNADVPSCYITL